MFRKLLLASLAVALMAGSALADGKKYIVASDATWPPMELLDNQKNVIGYSTDYINAVAKEAGIDIEVRNVAWDGILTGVGSDRYQIIASSVTITPERRKRLDFSDPYCEIHQAVTLPKGQSIKSLQDLKGKKVGGQISTTGIFVLRNSKVDADIREYDDVGLALRDLASGRLDAVICDEPVARY
ncbi:MAG: transporter substrate-binding domain-containing protein, partial [Desulfovibrionaceae bacterium]|nr:transporter substrate-binding domain-containing protein [Desulfovibrionaceae bacterium]